MRLSPALLLLPLSVACSTTLGGSVIADNGWPALPDEAEGYTGSGTGAVGDRIDPFVLPDQGGADVDYRQFLGFVVLLDAGATWCVPCQEAALTQQDLHEQLQSEGPAWVISLLLQDNSGGPPDTGDAAEWASTFGLQLPVLADARGEHTGLWNVESWPTALVVGPDGTILHRHDGPVDEQVLHDEVSQALVDYSDQLRELP